MWQPIVRELQFGRGYADLFDYYYLYTPSYVLCLIYNKNQANLLVIAPVTSSYADKHFIFPILRKHFNSREKVTNRINRKTTRTIVNVNRWLNGCNSSLETTKSGNCKFSKKHFFAKISHAVANFFFVDDKSVGHFLNLFRCVDFP